MEKNICILFFALVLLSFSICANRAFSQQIAEYPWSIPLTVSLDGNDKQLYFGTKVGATDGYDGSPIDTLAPPPPPQGLYVFFQIAGIPNITDKLSRDYRSVSKSPNAWTLKIIGTEGNNGTILWNSSNFPTGTLSLGSLTIDGVDMLAQNSMPFTGDQTLTIDYIAPTEPAGLVFRVERSTGDVYAKGSFSSEGADLAERIHVSEPVEPGDLVELDPTRPGHYRKARGYSHLIAGVITTKPGFTLGNRPEEMERATLIAAKKTLRPAAAARPLLALMGRVPVKATTENGPIRPGDLLTVSSKPGYAMRCADPKGCEGAIIGKALEALESGEGLILMLVMAH